METTDYLMDVGDYVLSGNLWVCVDIDVANEPLNEVVYVFEMNTMLVPLTESELLDALVNNRIKHLTEEEALLWKLRN